LALKATGYFFLMVPIFGSSLFDLTCILAYCPNFGVHYTEHEKNRLGN